MLLCTSVEMNRVRSKFDGKFKEGGIRNSLDLLDKLQHFSKFHGMRRLGKVDLDIVLLPEVN